MGFVTRFAPSPTGHLHLGHALSAWAVAGQARVLGARMLLRLEDIDPTRCRRAYALSIAEDLAWLGLTYDGPVVSQSARLSLYGEAIARLRALGLIYPCSCTRRQVAAAARAQGPDGPLYAGTCRDRGPVPGRPLAWRLNMAAALERVTGMTRDPRPWGDLVLVRRETPTSYHLAVVVDDAAQGISHVVRGKDLEAITAVHELLQRLLDLPRPAYLFHDLICHGDGRKYSKSERAPALRDLRAQGLRPEDLRLRLYGIPNLRRQIDPVEAGDFL